ncbi:MAG: hypothetical protein WBN29_17055, partial [Polyangiales bacterium]
MLRISSFCATAKLGCSHLAIPSARLAGLKSQGKRPGVAEAQIMRIGIALRKKCTFCALRHQGALHC